LNTVSKPRLEKNPESTRSNAETPAWLEEAKTEAKIVKGKGQFYELCFLDFNIDLESNTCSVTVDKDGKTDMNKACSYCYARYNFKKTIPFKTKRVREVTFKNLKNKVPEFSTLRIGKNTECGSPYTRDALISVLEYCVKYKVRPLVTSKTLEYDENVARLVKESNGVVHISLGRDDMETGAVELGFPNEVRLKNALKYQKYGCTTAVRVVEDVTLEIPKFIKKVKKLNMPILLTPLHYPDKKSFNQRRDDTWDEAKSNGLYTYDHGALRPSFVHDSWKDVKERCGLIGGKEFCNNCNLGKVKYSDEVGYSKKKYNEKLINVGWN